MPSPVMAVIAVFIAAQFCKLHEMDTPLATTRFNPDMQSFFAYFAD
jgi:hypothetical protein